MNARLLLLSGLLLSACGGGDRVPATQNHTEPKNPTSQQTANDESLAVPNTDGMHATATTAVNNQAREHALHNALYSAAYAEYPADREDAIEYLADLGEPAAVPVLREIALSDNAELRRAAVEALAEVAGEQSVHALGSMLDDDNTAVRVSVVEALEEADSTDSVGYLQQALSDSDSRVRAAAGLALEELHSD